MTREEAKKILSGYVKACNEDDFLALEMFEYEKVIEAMTMGAKALSMPELPSNLDEAAQKVEDYYDVGEERGYLYCHRGDIKDTFKAGAEWWAGQEVIVSQGTVDEVCNSNLSELLDRDDLSADEEIELFFRKK